MARCSVSSVSLIGGRTVNEDSVRVHKGWRRTILIVADGLGGMGQGDIASALAADTALAALKRPLRIDERALTRAFAEANEAVCREKERLDSRMMSTLAVAVIEAGHVFIGHTGDTRVYGFRDGRLMHVTQDHSVPQVLVSTGQLTFEEIRGHPARSMLLRALGDADARPEIWQETVRRGDHYLVASDGFWEPVLEAQMQPLSPSEQAQAWLSRLKEVAASGQNEDSDNMTAAVAVVL